MVKMSRAVSLERNMNITTLGLVSSQHIEALGQDELRKGKITKFSWIRTMKEEKV